MKNILCVAAHPDDLEFSCIGTLKKMNRQGYSINYVIVTNGESGFKHPNKNEKQRIKIRQKEQLQAAQLLNVKKVIFLDYKDGYLEYSNRLRKKITKIIKKYKPEKIFSFDPANNSFNNINLFHRDHRVVAEVVFDAIFAAKNRYIYKGKPHKIEEAYFYAAENYNHVEDITEHIQFKLDALKLFKSQYKEFKKLENFVVNEISKRSDKFQYSEVFRKVSIRQIL